MIKKLLLFLFFFNIFSFAEDFSTFENRQKILQKIRTIIVQEESIARAYESYLLKNLKIPTFSDLTTSDYLGIETKFLKDFDTTNFNSFTLNDLTLNYAFKSTDIKNDEDLKKLYESDTFRNRTYFQNNLIYFTFENEFAKHIYFLIKRQNSPILDCTNVSSKRYCTKDNHIYIYSDDTKSVLLMYYHKEKYKTGPFIITNNTTLYSNMEFSTIPKAIVLYDTDGKKYIKTTSEIKALK